MVEEVRTAPPPLKQWLSSAKRVKADQNDRESANVATDDRSSRRQTVRITFSSCDGMPRLLELKMPTLAAARWANGLQVLRRMVSSAASPAHWRWALSCMAATSAQGAEGFLHPKLLRSLLVRANAAASLSSRLIEKALQSVEVQRRLLPSWLTTSPEPASSRELSSRESGMSTPSARKRLRNRRHRLNAQEICDLLLHLCTSSSNEMASLFNRYAVCGRVSQSGWLAFCRDEQLPLSADGREQATASTSVAAHLHINEELVLAEAEERFERAGSAQGT
eukprot:2798640-Prymnesium_polylepis.1